MRLISVFTILLFSVLLFGQNLETRNNKEIKQPSKLNPALAGLQEDLIKILTDAQLGNGSGYQFMLEGKMPLKMGNYMIGYERISNEYVGNNTLNLTYGRSLETEKKFKFRYGGSMHIQQKDLFNKDQDTSNNYSFIDLNGDVVTVPKLSDLNTNLSHFNLAFGASINYDNLIASLSFENILNQNVSLVEGSFRNIPFSGNLMVGGFISLGDNYVLFPSVIGTLNGQETYLKSTVEFSTPLLNFSAAYTHVNEASDVSASIGLIYEKIFAGIKYTHPLTTLEQLPRFSLFFNSTLFKSRKWNKTDFAQKLKKFY